VFTHINKIQRLQLKRKMLNGRRWYVTPQNNIYPSITTVLGFEEKQWLKDWRTMLGKDKAEKESARCAERGTAVHNIVEQYLNNTLSTKDHKTEHIRLFNQIKPRLNKIDNIRGIELPLYSDLLQVAGTTDLIAEYESTLSVIDFKTSTNNKNDEQIEDYLLQTTSYALMYQELYKEPIENVVIIMTVERGIVPLVFVKKINNYIEPLKIRINKFYEEVIGV